MHLNEVLTQIRQWSMYRDGWVVGSMCDIVSHYNHYATLFIHTLILRDKIFIHHLIIPLSN